MRISTSKERDLQKFTCQESALQRYAKENNIGYLLEFKEDKSGKNFTERKQWKKHNISRNTLKKYINIVKNEK